jgi:branched-subunit amino acid aminotransferase/4-amino-4-deoxychorismate lyase
MLGQFFLGCFNHQTVVTFFHTDHTFQWILGTRSICVTPDALDGVTRSTIMRPCEQKLNLRVITCEYKLQGLKFSNEVFTTSTSFEVMPVVKVGNFTINQGMVGSVAHHLRQQLHRDMGLV